LDLAAQDSNSGSENNSEPKKSTTTFRKQVQAHTHWVNDIILVKNNLGLVSASSDVTVKLWRPHGHETTSAYTIGSHSDYVKCLTSPGPQDNWVASGGLDHRICLWDLNGGGQTLEINVAKADNVVKGSIYTLQANGPVVASGGPEGVVRLWDIKSGKSITKFVGHTDNVRDILISEDGDTILSASSDQTIKAWSLTAGRCLHTLTMHNDSVWCMYSDDPHLAVFYSGDKSGLVAKTDTRRAMEIEEGVSVGVCQEHDGIAKVVTAGNSIWTATSSSSVNRWKDVDTELEVETPPSSPRMERSGSALSRSMDQQSPPTSPPPLTNGVHSKSQRIPHTAILRLANTALHPGRKFSKHPNQSATNLRKASEAMIAHDLSLVIPIRGQPAETIEGQNGLIKHHMLNDRKRILTLDTAGEVVLWDLLKCAPIKSFGRRHLDEVVPDVNTTESVANWCSVDTKTGKITVQLEENYCFDAEVYADEIDIPEKIDFREDQRINLGKWVLRNLFGTLIDEEIRRDASHRKTMRAEGSIPTGSLRPNAPRNIAMPETSTGTAMISPETMTTPRANNGNTLYPTTPGLAIGSQPLSPRAEDDNPLDKSNTRQSQPPATDGSADYFSAPAPAQESESSSEHKEPGTPSAVGGPSAPTSPTEEKKKSGLFGKKFQMGFPKKIARQSAEVKPPTTEPEKSDSGSTKSSDKEEKVIHDNFFGVVQKIRQEYDEHGDSRPEEPLPIGITPSLPIETPVLKPPPHTLIIIQEDNPESGGLADQYRGEISQLGVEADTLEKIAPVWLGDLLLRVCLFRLFPLSQCNWSFLACFNGSLLPSFHFHHRSFPSIHDRFLLRDVDSHHSFLISPYRPFLWLPTVVVPSWPTHPSYSFHSYSILCTCILNTIPSHLLLTLIIMTSHL
jgi:WD repeat-containing protein 48